MKQKLKNPIGHFKVNVLVVMQFILKDFWSTLGVRKLVAKKNPPTFSSKFAGMHGYNGNPIVI